MKRECKAPRAVTGLRYVFLFPPEMYRLTGWTKPAVSSEQFSADSWARPPNAAGVQDFGGQERTLGLE